jgi:hypothetical protein
MSAKGHAGKISCWRIVSCGIVSWRNVMLANCQLGNCKLANCHVGEKSCWQIVMLVNCHVGPPCLHNAATRNCCLSVSSHLTLFSRWNSCTGACGFINEHDGQNFTASCYFAPSTLIAEPHYAYNGCISSHQQSCLAWRCKMSTPCAVSQIHGRREVSCFDTHTNFEGMQLWALQIS